MAHSSIRPELLLKQEGGILLFLPRYAILSVMGGEFSSPLSVYKRFILPNGGEKVKVFFVNICNFRRCFFVRFDGFRPALQCPRRYDMIKKKPRAVRRARRKEFSDDEAYRHR